MTSVFAALMSACAPVTQHGPWVREGVSGGFMASGVAMGEEGSGDLPATMVGIDGSLRAGLVPADTSLPAFAAGVQMSLWTLLLVSDLDNPLDALRVASADLYVTGPRSAKLTSAIGGTVGHYHFMPYVQIGSRSPVAGGWYSTQAFLVLDDDELEGGYMWLPSLTFVTKSSRPRATHFSIGGGIGRKEGAAWYLFTLAAGMEFFRAGARVR